MREKGLGYFGQLRRPDGYVSTELSIGVNIDGKETEIPTLVPTLRQDEINYLLEHDKPSKQIVDKAVEHAKKRIAEGKNPFAQKGEQLPKWSPHDLQRTSQLQVTKGRNKMPTARYIPARTNPRLTQPLLYGTEEEFGIEYPEGYQAPEPGEDDQVLAGMKEREVQRRTGLREEIGRPKYFPDIMKEAGDREEFRRSAIKQLPGQQDPYMRDVFRETRILFDQRIDGLRKYVFKGLPRGAKLTDEQEAHFAKQAQQLFQRCYAEASANQNTAKDALSNMMSRFDRMAEERKAKETSIQKTREEQAKPGFFEKETFKAGLKEVAEERKEKIWIYHPELKRKVKIKPSALPQWEKKGYVRGQPYGGEERETGKLGEASVLNQFDNLSLDLGKPDLKDKLYRRYRNLKTKENLSREEAYARTIEEFQQNVYNNKYYETTRVLPGKGTWGKEEDGSWTRIR